MKNLFNFINEASINSKKRNVKFIKDLMLNGKNVGNIGSFVIFTSENPNSQSFDRKTNDKLRKDLAKELKRCHYIHLPVKGFFEGNEEQSTIVFNMRLDVAKEWNYKYQQTSFFYIYPKTSKDGFVAEYWEKTNCEKPVDNVRNPYIKKGETDMQYEGEAENGAYTLINNEYKFHFDSSLFSEANITIDNGLNIICERYNITDKNWLIDYLTNNVGQKISYMRSLMIE
jgi:hypothetical protein